MSISRPRLAAIAASALILSSAGVAAQGIQLDLNNGRIGVVPPRDERREFDRRGPRIIEDERVGITCGEGRRIVSRRGFRDVRVLDCGGRSFTYAARERGERVEVRVSSRNGRIVSVEPL